MRNGEPTVSSDELITRGDMRTERVDIPCPVCGAENMLLTSIVLDLPYIGECLETTISCEKCGYRHSDTLITAQKQPVRYTMAVEEEKDLKARVVRSTSGTIRIPEAGLKVEPGTASEAFISNIEGVINRFEEAVGFALRNAEDDDKRRRAEEILDFLSGVRDGRERCTVIIEDPLGNSAILADKVREEILSPEEAEKLALGMNVIDLRG